VIVGKGKRVGFVLVASTESVVEAGGVASPVDDASVGDAVVGNGENENFVVEELSSVGEAVVGIGNNENLVVEELPSVGESVNFGVEDAPSVGVVGTSEPIVDASVGDEPGVPVASPALAVVGAESAEEDGEADDEICSGVGSHVSEPINLPCIQHCHVAFGFSGGGLIGSPSERSSWLLLYRTMPAPNGVIWLLVSRFGL